MNQYTKGCFGAAWDDIINSHGWVGRILLLGLINLVPILNFVVIGYAMRWSRDLLLGKIAPMPEKIFQDRAFVNGFFAFVIGLVVGIVTYICCGILAVVPVLGALAAIALSVFTSMFMYLMIMRTAVFDDLGAGFDIRSCWDVFKKNLGSLFCAAYLPELIVYAASGIIVLVIGGFAIIPMIGIAIGAAAGGTFVSAVGSGLSFLLMAAPVVLIAYIIVCFAGALGTVWSMRAVGHYVAREAQEWVR